jgi:hypothetical protein
VKITTMTKSTAAVAIATIGIATATVASASAYPITSKLGSTLTMVDSVGQVTLSWTVSNLEPSSDVMPDYPVAGKLCSFLSLSLSFFLGIL